MINFKFLPIFFYFNKYKYKIYIIEKNIIIILQKSILFYIMKKIFKSLSVNNGASKNSEKTDFKTLINR